MDLLQSMSSSITNDPVLLQQYLSASPEQKEKLVLSFIHDLISKEKKTNAVGGSTGSDTKHSTSSNSMLPGSTTTTTTATTTTPSPRTTPTSSVIGKQSISYANYLDKEKDAKESNFNNLDSLQSSIPLSVHTYTGLVAWEGNPGNDAASFTKFVKSCRLFCRAGDSYIGIKSSGDPTGLQQSFKLPASAPVVFEQFPHISDPNAFNRSIREVITIFGPSNSGKSTLAARYAQWFVKIYPNASVFLFVNAGVNDQDTYDLIEVKDKTRIKRVDVEDWTEENLKVDHFQDSLVIFDDVSEMSGHDANKKACLNFRAHILTAGRKKGIFVISCEHIYANALITKPLRIESNFLTFFPRSNTNDMTNYCTHMLRLSRKQIEYFKQLNTHQITFMPSFPICYFADRIVSLLNV